MKFEEWIVVVAGCYILAIIVVLLSGGVPTAWRTWTTIHIIALGIPMFFFLLSISIAFPGILLLILIIAAVSR